MTALTKPLSLEEMIAHINGAGYRVNNLFQLPAPRGIPALWQANLTDGEKLWEFGTGGSPSSALGEAWQRARTSQGEPPLVGLPGAPLPTSATGSRRVKPKVKGDGSTLEAIMALDLDL